jgi:hypothetical protein
MVDKTIGMTKKQFIKHMYESLISNFDNPSKEDKKDMLREANYEFELLLNGNLAGYEEYSFEKGRIIKE